MFGEMHQDADLLQTLIADAPPAVDGTPVTAKRLAYWSGYALKTVYDFASGRLTIPVRFWRSIYPYLRDQRVVDLLLGGVQYDLVEHDRVPDLTGSRAGFDAALQSLQAWHEQQKLFGEIVRDGRIDEYDTDAVQRYHAAYLEQRRHAASVHRAVMTTFAKSVTAQGGAR